MQTDRLVSYKTGSYPQLPGGDAKFITQELRSVQNAIASTQTILRDLETAGTVISKDGVPVASDVAEGTWKIIHDTVNGTVGIYVNVGGTLFKALLE